MKKFKIGFAIIFIATLLVWSCQNDDPTFGDIIAPTNIVVSADIVGQDADNPYGDGSGVINFSAHADNAITYKFITTGGQQVAPSGNAAITFNNIGINTYQVSVLAIGTGGITSSTTIEVEVLVTYEAPQDLLDKLVGDGSRAWRIKSEKPKHFGLGPVGGNIPAEYYGAGPEEKAGAGMYDDRYVFNSDGTFTLITNNTNDDPTNNPEGTVFGRDPFVMELGGVGGGEQQGADILNYPYNDHTDQWSIIAPGGVETIVLTGNAFIGYYTGGNHKYQIFDRSVSNELLLTTVDGNGEFSWWFIITSQEPGEEGFNSIYNNLVFEDNFDVNGAPNPSNWAFDLGGGVNGWGNGEEQFYTDSPNNISVADGFLKITAKKEGSTYTSSRIKSENLFEFTYGRVEVRAKLPTGGGTWPAIWMLGQDYATNSWPGCGEIDIMEHVGNDQNKIHATLHYPGNSGGNGVTNSIIIPTASTAFHNYTVEWTPDEIKFLVDDTVYHTFANSSATPFHNDFFIILNVAMGGNFGGTIDPTFTESTMEID
ncbi:MAG: glycoside hydrolase family 16 protein, partial [Aquaticitalea sp.]